MLTLVSFNAFDDNYIWLLHDSKNALVVDPGDAAQVTNYLQAHGIGLAAIFCTHHHHDHIGGIAALTRQYPTAKVYTPDTQRFEGIRTEMFQTRITVLNTEFEVISVPGHTIDHIAFYSAPWLFCGDTMFGAGCGRLFEGTPSQMQTSLATLATLPDDTQVCCAHEYTLSNLKFASATMPTSAAVMERIARDSEKRAQGQSTLPSTIGLEKLTNPFLNTDDPELISQVERWLTSQPGIQPSEASTFAALREWKNRY